jgi:hypothetical protein
VDSGVHSLDLAAIPVDVVSELLKEGVVHVECVFGMQSVRTGMSFLVLLLEFIDFLVSQFFELMEVFLTFVESLGEIVGVVHEIFELCPEVEIDGRLEHQIFSDLGALLHLLALGQDLHIPLKQQLLLNLQIVVQLFEFVLRYLFRLVDHVC